MSSTGRGGEEWEGQEAGGRGPEPLKGDENILRHDMMPCMQNKKRRPGCVNPNMVPYELR